MRIGMITGEYPPMQGGVGDFTRELARALATLGHEVFVLSRPTGTGANDPGVHVSPIVRRWGIRSISTVGRWARENRLDVLNLQYQTAAYDMSPWIHVMPRVLRTPFVVTFHDLRFPYLFPKAGPLRPWIVRELARGAEGVIVTNREDEIELAEAHGISPLRRIPIGSNIAPDIPPDYSRDSHRAALGVGNDELLIGFFGFLNRSKGPDLLIRALARISAQGVPAKLLMIGGRAGSSDPTNAEYGRQIDALIEEMGLSDSVLWTGFIGDQDVSACLRAVDVCALPYRDGISFRRGTLMAALAHGCPVVSTRPPIPLPELREGENVVLVKPNDPDALADAILRVWSDSELRARLARGSAELAGLFTWERIAMETAAFFEDVLSVKRPAPHR